MDCTNCGSHFMRYETVEDWAWNVNDGLGGEEYRVELPRWLCTCGHVVNKYDEGFEYPAIE